jgi:Uma2 family endonuclease
MNSAELMTAAQFAAQKFDLPEGGRWHELHLGRPELMTAPDDLHGVVVLNLSRAIAKWLQGHSGARAYAVHELGLQIQRNPDTVIVPAMSIFSGGIPFGQSDLVVATEVPRLVVDIASANDRRRDMRMRTTGCLHAGVETIWIPDSFKKEIQVIHRGAHTLALGKWQTLEGGTVLPGFSIAVEAVFAQPDWWMASSRN